MQVDAQTYELIKRRASYSTYSKYRINRYELWLLHALSGLLRHYNRQIIGKRRFFDHCTSNSREKIKMEGYLKGCRDKGFIARYEYKLKPGSYCLGITDLGLHVMEENIKSIQSYLERYKAQTAKSTSLVLTDEPYTLTAA